MEAIIFDVDGTLWDSTKVVEVAWNKAIEETTDLDRRLTAEELKKEFGKPLEAIVESLFPGMSKGDMDRLSEALFTYENAMVAKEPCILYEGMMETIPKLAKRYKLFIVSNCQAGYIEAFLENTGLGEFFVDFTCPGETGKLKADNLKIIMERNHLTEAVYVGDTHGDEQACEEAGVPMIYAAYGFGDVVNEHVSITCFSELDSMEL
ncbi:MAG: HAD family hydrolase [Lachnospiraceae bacterium]|nr:HAD family hydrolase [Lachnospiraceae bacterium]